MDEHRYEPTEQSISVHTCMCEYSNTAGTCVFNKAYTPLHIENTQTHTTFGESDFIITFNAALIFFHNCLVSGLSSHKSGPGLLSQRRANTLISSHINNRSWSFPLNTSGLHPEEERGEICFTYITSPGPALIRSDTHRLQLLSLRLHKPKWLLDHSL